MLLLPERSVAEPCLLQHRMHVVLPEGNITHKHILRCSHRTHQCLVLVSSNSKMENNYGAGHQAIFYSLNYFLTRSAPTFAYHCIIIRPANYILFSQLIFDCHHFLCIIMIIFFMKHQLVQIVLGFQIGTYPDVEGSNVVVQIGLDEANVRQVQRDASFPGPNKRLLFVFHQNNLIIKKNKERVFQRPLNNLLHLTL